MTESGRNISHLSASSINNYLECGQQYRFSRLEKLPAEFTPDNLIYGATIHKVVAEFYQIRKDGNHLPLPEMLEKFEEYWRAAAEDQPDILYSEGKDFETLLKEGLELLKVFHTNLPEDHFQVLAIEQPFQFSAEGLRVPIIGIFDLVEEDASGTIIVSDLKTSSRAYSTNEIDKNLQLTLYQLAVKHDGYHDREIILRLDCLIKTKKPRFEQYYTFRTPEDEQRLLKKIRKVYEGIARGVFIPNDTNWKCPNCAFKSYCDSWFAE